MAQEHPPTRKVLIRMIRIIAGLAAGYVLIGGLAFLVIRLARWAAGG